MKIGLSLGLLAIATGAVAEENAWYIGAGSGGTNFESETLTVNLPLATPVAIGTAVDDSDNNLRLYGGYRFAPNWAVEATYSNLGEFELIDDTNQFDVTYDASSFDIAGVGLLPVWDGRVDLFARAGIAFWSFDSEVTAQSSLAVTPTFASRPESSGQDLFWSVGFNINAFEDKRWTFRYELTTYEIGDAEKLATQGFNIQYRF